MKKIKNVDVQLLRPAIEIAVKEALEASLGIPIHQRVLDSRIQYTPLVPEGHAFQISIRVELHEKTATPEAN
jgi:hypothetical protein